MKIFMYFDIYHQEGRLPMLSVRSEDDASSPITSLLQEPKFIEGFDKIASSRVLTGRDALLTFIRQKFPDRVVMRRISEEERKICYEFSEA